MDEQTTTDSTQLNPPPTRAPEELGESGKKALATLREENKALRKQIAQYSDNLSRFEGIDPGAVASMQEELGQLRQEKEKLSGHLRDYRNLEAFKSVAKDKIDPGYVDIAWSHVRSDVRPGEDGQLLVGDSPLSDAIDNFVEQFPKMAIASAGSGQSRGDTVGNDGGKTLLTSETFMDNLDAVIRGEASLG